MCLSVCVFIAVVLMLPLTQNPSLSPAMRLQPAMGNADYCCYSIRQSACVCMCVCVCMRVCVCVCMIERNGKRKRENGYYPRPGAKCFSLPSFRSRTIFSHATPIPHHSGAVNQSFLQKTEITVCCIATD